MTTIAPKQSLTDAFHALASASSSPSFLWTSFAAAERTSGRAFLSAIDRNYPPLVASPKHRFNDIGEERTLFIDFLAILEIKEPRERRPPALPPAGTPASR